MLYFVDVWRVDWVKQKQNGIKIRYYIPLFGQLRLFIALHTAKPRPCLEAAIMPQRIIIYDVRMTEGLWNRFVHKRLNM